MSQIAGVAIDAWKLTIFRKHLRGASFSFTEGPGPADTLMLRVQFEPAEIARLTRVLNEANAAAARQSRVRTGDDDD